MRTGAGLRNTLAAAVLAAAALHAQAGLAQALQKYQQIQPPQHPQARFSQRLPPAASSAFYEDFRERAYDLDPEQRDELRSGLTKKLIDSDSPSRTRHYQRLLRALDAIGGQEPRDR